MIISKPDDFRLNRINADIVERKDFFESNKIQPAVTSSVVFIAPETVELVDDSSLLTIDSNYYDYLNSNDGMLDRNSNNDIISQYKEGILPGVLVKVPIKTYNELQGDTTISELLPPKVQTGPTITLQPHQYFRKTDVETYIHGGEVLVDDNNTVKIQKGTEFQLNIAIETTDITTLTYEWKDEIDAVIGTGSTYTFNSNIFDSKSKSIYCVVTNKYGSDISDTITVEMIDSTNPFIENNLIKNGFAVEGTNEWESVGANPEEIGSYSTKRYPAYVYHNFRTDTVNGAENVPVNQWYPTPEAFEADNPKFKDKIINKISENRYFRGGLMIPRDDLNNDTSGLYKSSYQDIDVSDIADLIDGKVFGIEKLTTILFGWLGTRADQGDKCSVQYEFFDENDNFVYSLENGTKLGGSYIESAGGSITWVIRNNQTNTESDINSSIIYLGGTFGSSTYTGLLNDNINIFHPLSIKGYKNIVTPGSIVGSLDFNESNPTNTLNTIILGRISELRTIPIGTRKIRVTKSYWHDSLSIIPTDGPNAGQRLPITLWDLLYTNRNPQSYGGGQYTSEAMATGLNLIVYVNDDGIDDIKGIDMLKESGYVEDFTSQADENILSLPSTMFVPSNTPTNESGNNTGHSGGGGGGGGHSIQYTQ